MEHGLKPYLPLVLGAIFCPAVAYACDQSLPSTDLLKLGLLFPFYCLAFRGLKSWFPTEWMARSNARLAEYAGLNGFVFAIFMLFVRDLARLGGEVSLRSILWQLLATMALMSLLIFATGVIAKRSGGKANGDPS